MIFHDVHLLCHVFKLDCFGTFVAAGSVLLVLIGGMRGALLGILLKELKLFRRVLGAMHQAYIFSHRSYHHSYGLHCFSCACQSGPAQGWMVRRRSLTFSSCHTWNGRIVPVGYFWEVLLLRKLPPRFTCNQKSCMYPCRTFIKNPIPVCRLVLPTSWGQREGESC